MNLLGYEQERRGFKGGRCRDLEGQSVNIRTTGGRLRSRRERKGRIGKQRRGGKEREARGGEPGEPSAERLAWRTTEGQKCIKATQARDVHKTMKAGLW